LPEPVDIQRPGGVVIERLQALGIERRGGVKMAQQQGDLTELPFEQPVGIPPLRLIKLINQGKNVRVAPFGDDRPFQPAQMRLKHCRIL